jgi:hypothetical protein
LPLEAWRATKETLHRYCQMLGKVRLALVPFRNHWWHVTLYVTARGLATGPMPVGDGRVVEIGLNLGDHAVELEDSAGQQRSFALHHPPACATFHDQLLDALAGLDVPVRIDPRPYDLEGPPFPNDYDNDAYDAEAATRYWRALRASAGVLDEFAGWFNGKQSPVHLFWHSFDLALARFSGRRAPARPGAGLVEAEAYSHEVIAFGFWPGDDTVPYPATTPTPHPRPTGSSTSRSSPPQRHGTPNGAPRCCPTTPSARTTTHGRHSSRSARAPTSRERAPSGGTSTTSRHGSRRHERRHRPRE